jgi:hypothetical protein
VIFCGVTRTISRSTSPASLGGPCPRYFCQSGRSSDLSGSLISSAVPRMSTDWYGFSASKTVRLTRGSRARFLAFWRPPVKLHRHSLTVLFSNLSSLLARNMSEG